MMTTSKPVSELARKLATEQVKVRESISEHGFRIIVFDRTLLTLCIRESDAQTNAEILRDRIVEAMETVAALTRKQTIADAITTINELPTFHKSGEYNSYEMRSMAAAAIREMEV